MNTCRHDAYDSLPRTLIFFRAISLPESISLIVIYRSVYYYPRFACKRNINSSRSIKTTLVLAITTGLHGCGIVRNNDQFLVENIEFYLTLQYTPYSAIGSLFPDVPRTMKESGVPWRVVKFLGIDATECSVIRFNFTYFADTFILSVPVGTSAASTRRKLDCSRSGAKSIRQTGRQRCGVCSTVIDFHSHRCFQSYVKKREFARSVFN